MDIIKAEPVPSKILIRPGAVQWPTGNLRCLPLMLSLAWVDQLRLHRTVLVPPRRAAPAGGGAQRPDKGGKGGGSRTAADRPLSSPPS